MTSARPSAELLRSVTDEHVLRALMTARRLTRSELAARTGLSKPTASESVRRLAEAGLVADTGARTPGGRGRGRVGSYFALADDVGVALALSVAPSGVVAECVDSYGDVLARCRHDIAHPVHPARVARAVETTAGRVLSEAGAPCRLAAVSAADPVDRATGRLVHLPDSPFLVGELAPAGLLASLVRGPVVVDNDVNWAARAERAAAADGELDDFAYVYLGAGLGCAMVSDGEVRRGHSGLAGEITHLLTAGAAGGAVPFTEVFAELGLRQRGSAAIDVAALLAAVRGPGRRQQETLAVIGAAVSGVLAGIVALADPELIVIGGPWGPELPVLESVSARFRRRPRHIPVRAATVTDDPSLGGTRRHALDGLRADIVARAAAGPAANSARAAPAGIR